MTGEDDPVNWPIVAPQFFTLSFLYPGLELGRVAEQSIPVCIINQFLKKGSTELRFCGDFYLNRSRAG